MLLIDSHVHSKNSDGDQTPEELFKIAKNKEAKGFIIADHNTFDNNIKDVFRQYGIWACTGTEISSGDNFYNKDAEIHILHYANDISNEIDNILKNYRFGKQNKVKNQIIQLCSIFKGNYDDFVKFWINRGVGIDNLNSNNVFLYIKSIEDNEKKIKKLLGENYNIGHFINGFLKEKGFDGKTGIGYVDTPNLNPKLEEYKNYTSKKSILSVAHPNFSFYKKQDEESNIADFIKYFDLAVKHNINAIEINLKAPEIWVKTAIELSRKYNIILTFGSDFHSFNYKTDNQILKFNKYVDDILIKENFEKFKDIIEIGY